MIFLLLLIPGATATAEEQSGLAPAPGIWDQQCNAAPRRITLRVRATRQREGSSEILPGIFALPPPLPLSYTSNRKGLTLMRRPYFPSFLRLITTKKEGKKQGRSGGAVRSDQSWCPGLFRPRRVPVAQGDPPMMTRRHGEISIPHFSPAVPEPRVFQFRPAWNVLGCLLPCRGSGACTASSAHSASRECATEERRKRDACYCRETFQCLPTSFCLFRGVFLVGFAPAGVWLQRCRGSGTYRCLRRVAVAAMALPCPALVVGVALDLILFGSHRSCHSLHVRVSSGSWSPGGPAGTVAARPPRDVYF